MGRQSKCPGCKALKSAHDFGRPGKDCTGPVHNDTEQDREAADELEHTDEVGATASSNPDVLQSLTASVQLLSTELKSLRQETNELRALVRPASSQQQQAPAVPPLVTLPELRAMTALAKTVDRRVEHLGVGGSDDSESENEIDPIQQSGATSAPSSRPGKLKSGREAKATSEVLYPQRWPHSFLCITRAQREVKYEELTLAEFVAGYAQILLCKDITPLEHTEREKHLVSLMYFAQQYEWSAVLNFHGSVLLEIERGLVKWGDSYLHLESRTLYGHPLKEKSPTSSAPVLFCRDYQREQCISVKDHFGFIRGERKWLKHICAACWTRLRKQESHRENSSDCPLKDSAKDSPATSKN